MTKDYFDSKSAWEYVLRYYGAESVVDCAEGVLLDSYLVQGRKCLVAMIETYLNPWSSCLTRYIARTERDKRQLWEMFDSLHEGESE